jgi:hypothetical protein
MYPIIIPDSANNKNAITLAKIYGIKPSLILNDTLKTNNQ